MERFSIQYRKTKTKVITSTNFNRRKQRNSKQIHATGAKRRKTRTSEARLVLVLLLIGWETGANFVNLSQSTVKQNQSKCEITFDTQMKTALICQDQSNHWCIWQSILTLNSLTSVIFFCNGVAYALLSCFLQLSIQEFHTAIRGFWILIRVKFLHTSKSSVRNNFPVWGLWITFQYLTETCQKKAILNKSTAVIYGLYSFIKNCMVGHFTVVCLVSWLGLKARLGLTLFW